MFKTKYKIVKQYQPYPPIYKYAIYKKEWLFGIWSYVASYILSLEEAEKIIEADKFVKYI